MASKLIQDRDLETFTTVKSVVDDVIIAYVSDTVFEHADYAGSVHPRMIDFLNFLQLLFRHADFKHDVSASQGYYNQSLEVYRNLMDSERYSSPISF